MGIPAIRASAQSMIGGESAVCEMKAILKSTKFLSVSSRRSITPALFYLVYFLEAELLRLN